MLNLELASPPDGIQGEAAGELAILLNPERQDRRGVYEYEPPPPNACTGAISKRSGH